MKVAGYVRVSTDRQAEKGFGLDVQERAVKAWARRHGHRLVEIHRDEGVSGSNGLDTRVGLADALQSLRDRKANGLVVPRLDRLARDLVLQETLLGEVRRLGGEMFSCSDAEAEFLVAGDGSPPYGWQAVDGALAPVEAEQRAIHRIRELHAGGHSLRSIADALHAEGHRPKRGDRWHPQTLARVLARRAKPPRSS